MRGEDRNAIPKYPRSCDLAAVHAAQGGGVHSIRTSIHRVVKPECGSISLIWLSRLPGILMRGVIPLRLHEMHMRIPETSQHNIAPEAGQPFGFHSPSQAEKEKARRWRAPVLVVEQSAEHNRCVEPGSSYGERRPGAARTLCFMFVGIGGSKPIS